MSEDIVDRILGLRYYVHVPVASVLFEEAVAEIERLRRVAEGIKKGDESMGEDYQVVRLKQRVKELEEWQEKAREDIKRMEKAIVELSKPRGCCNADN